MKFNYEFEFDVEDFAEYIEEDYFDDNVELNEERNKEWIADKLYDYCCDTSCCDISCPSIFIISTDIEDDTKKYYPQIVDEAYEMLENKRKVKEEFKVHLKAIKEYCENRRGEIRNDKCSACPFYKYCGSCFDNWEL